MGAHKPAGRVHLVDSCPRGSIWLSDRTLWCTLGSTRSLHSVLRGTLHIDRLSPFHPMARYPGPMLTKVSKIYMVYVVRKGSPWVWIRRQHQKYGQVVRIGEQPRA